MLKSRYAIFGMALGVVGVVVGPAVAGTTYAGPGVIAQCANSPLIVTGVGAVDSKFTSVKSPAAFGAGGACFQVPAGKTSVHVSVTDATGKTIAFNVQYQSKDGYTNSSTISEGCGSGTFTFPTDLGANTGYIYVFTEDPANAELGKCATPSVPTEGSISATFA